MHSVQISTMRSMSGWAPPQILCFGQARLQVHRQRRAQVGEAGVHLAADRAAVRARRCGRRETGRRRARFVRYCAIASVFHTRAPSCDEARHPDRRREQQQLAARVGVVGRDHRLVEVEPGEARQQPAAQRPRRVVLAPQRQRRARGRRRRRRSARLAAGLRRRAAAGGRWASSSASAAGIDAKHMPSSPLACWRASCNASRPVQPYRVAP